MIRKTLTIVSFIGLLLSVAAWATGYFNIVYYSPSRGWLLHTGGGAIRSSADERSTPIAVRLENGWVGYVRNGGFHSLGFKTLFTLVMPPVIARNRLVLPLWIPTLLFAAPFLLPLFPSIQRFRRRKLGLCIKCGYDLRASKDRCPECGQEFETK